MNTTHRMARLVFVLLCLAVLPLNGMTLAQEDHTPRPEIERASPIALSPAAGSEIGFVYEAYLSPHQEGGEEEEVPPLTPSQFRSTAPSVPRNERSSRGHAVIEFTNDLSRAYVHLAIENVNVDDIVMLHLHCGRPGQLGPILVDLSLIGNINDYLADGVLTVEVTNDDIVGTLGHSSGVVGAFTVGCPIVPTIPTDRVRTVGGMEQIARQGELYFNLHTKGQTFFGDIRGAFYLVETDED
jgi:hypothetical protein